MRSTPTASKGIYPGLIFLNTEFDFRSLRNNLKGHQILHLATHGAFVSGRPEDSFILLGTGEKLTLPEIQTLKDLSDIHLVVLSGSETALGGIDQNGEEIVGVSYYFLQAGAKAVLASLWNVDDRATSLLMQEFYSNLSKGTVQAPVTKAEALRQAQISFLSQKSQTFNHPFYWAPFILIGNPL